MSLSQKLREYIAAAFTGLWIQSHEHPDALSEMTGLCRERQWTLAVWDIERGLHLNGSQSTENVTTTPGAATDPLAAIKSLPAMAPGSDHPEGSSLLVLVNFHRFLHSAEVIQALAHAVQRGKQDRTFIVILSPIVSLPAELEKLFVVIEHDLPDRKQLRHVAAGIATEPGEMPAEGSPQFDQLLDAAVGLTRFEAEGAFSLSLVREGTLAPATVWELKAAALRQSGLLTLHRGGESFTDLGGLDALKAFCTRSLRRTKRVESFGDSDARSTDRARPRGVLLLSPPGCGKSQFAKALGHESGRPTLVLDVGSLFGGVVGETERNVRQALRLAEAMAPAVLMIDEVEKAFAGVGSAQGDGGVSARLFGTFLTWLSDHHSDVYVVCTSNDITKLPPEFSRAERFDAVFFLDTPGSAEKDKIWPIHLKRYGLEADSPRPDDRQWTGAEIQSCCRLAALLDESLKDAAKHVVPVAVTAAESVETLRSWAAGRCLDASRPGLYTRGARPPTSPSARKVSRPTSN